MFEIKVYIGQAFVLYTTKVDLYSDVVFQSNLTGLSFISVHKVVESYVNVIKLFTLFKEHFNT